MAERIDLSGHRYGRWTVIVPAISGPRSWVCRCDCGFYRFVSACHLRTGKSRSCGCLKDELARNRLKHGGAKGGRRSPECSIWRGMVRRCHDPKEKSYARYGALGITVCERWRSDFAAFLSDMGPRPSPAHSIDRKNGAKGYSPDNCRWATDEEQSLNRRATIRVRVNGEEMPLGKAADALGLVRSTVYARVDRSGLPVVFALWG